MPAVILATVFALLHRELSEYVPDGEGSIVKYTKLSYTDMRSKLADLAELHPDVMQLTDSAKMLGIEHEVNCETGVKCVIDIVTLTD